MRNLKDCSPEVICDLTAGSRIFLQAEAPHAAEVRDLATEFIDVWTEQFRGISTVGTAHCAVVFFTDMGDDEEDLGRVCAESLTRDELSLAVATPADGDWLLSFNGINWQATRLADERNL